MERPAAASAAVSISLQFIFAAASARVLCLERLSFDPLSVGHGLCAFFLWGDLAVCVRLVVLSPQTSLLEARSLTAEAFRQSIREQLHQYFKLLAVLEEDIVR